MEPVAPISNILSCQAIQYGYLDTLNVKIRLLLMQWDTAVGLEKMLHTENGEQTEKPITEATLIADESLG